MKVATKPDRLGEHEAAVKTIAQGKSDCLRWTCMLVGVLFVQFAHGTAGAARIRLSLRPLFGGARIFLAKLGRSAPRDRRPAPLGAPFLFVNGAGQSDPGADQS